MLLRHFIIQMKKPFFRKQLFIRLNQTLFLKKEQIQKSIKKSNARIITVNPDFFVIEKTGFRT